MTIIICRPATLWVRTVARCWNCKQRRRIVGFDQTWYGITWTCCHCGDGWCGGETTPRPFARGWRRQSIERARAHWPEAVRFLGPEHREWTDHQLRAELAGTEAAK